ncbi:uncharacterized protein LOC142803418 [Rhipicephalus microplus]|uniref:uncharacterized protein LOC142803418 n=1 Tax=Rhipicephalus microplus TaxID=6941 RepID=UPI003F6A9079
MQPLLHLLHNLHLLHLLYLAHHQLILHLLYLAHHQLILHLLYLAHHQLVQVTIPDNVLPRVVADHVVRKWDVVHGDIHRAETQILAAVAASRTCTGYGSHLDGWTSD